jgi:hypothetical protein
MSYFDIFGWYTSTPIAGRQAPTPTNTSETTTPGEQRANWTGYVWEDLPYAAYTAPEITPPVPFEVTMRQARLALFGAGLLGGVQAAIDALSEPTKTAAQIEWDYSNTLQRTNPFVATLGGALGLTSAQIDDLFIAAEKL